MPWFSTRIRLVVLVDPEGATHYSDSIRIFHLDDGYVGSSMWDAALQRAISIGKQQEEEYSNGDGDRVRWRMQKVVSLDMLSAENLDGAEVYSESVDLEEGMPIPFDTAFNPETSTPTQTGI